MAPAARRNLSEVYFVAPERPALPQFPEDIIGLLEGPDGAAARHYGAVFRFLIGAKAGEPGPVPRVNEAHHFIPAVHHGPRAVRLAVQVARAVPFYAGLKHEIVVSAHHVQGIVLDTAQAVRQAGAPFVQGNAPVKALPGRQKPPNALFFDLFTHGERSIYRKP